MQKINYYETKENKLSGSNLGEVYKEAYKFYRNIEKRTKRRPYVRSKYFKKQKIFLNLFWQHLKDKNPRDRFIRLKFLACAIDLLAHNLYVPESKITLITKKKFYIVFMELRRAKKYFMFKLKKIKNQNTNISFLYFLKENKKFSAYV